MPEIFLDKDAGRILLYTEWALEIPEACKAVSGAEWNPTAKRWEYPLHWEICLELRELATFLQRPLKFTPAMLEWATAERKRQDQLPDTHVIDKVVPLPRVQARNARMYTALASRPFQTVGVDFGVKNRKVLLADDPGLGKTIQTLAMVEEADLRGPILVVANPAAQQLTWPNEIEQWTQDEYLVFDKSIKSWRRDAEINEIFAECEADPTKRIWVLMNPYWVRMKLVLDGNGNYVYDQAGQVMKEAEVPAIFKMPWAAIIADESHETLATNTNQPKKWSQQRLGMGNLLLQDNGLKISISGTPMRGKPENMFGQLQWLHPELYTSFWKWASRHFHMETDDWTGGAKIGKLISQEKFYKELRRLMLRRSKGQVAADLPPKMYGGERFDPSQEDSLIGVWLPMTPEQKKAYHLFLEMGWLEDDDKQLTAVGYLAKMTRLKQLATACAGLEEIRELIVDDDGNWILDEDGLPAEEKTIMLHPKLPSNKFDWLVNFLSERDLLGKDAGGTQKIIIASQFRRVIDLFRKELLEVHKTESYHITGNTKMSDRQKFVKEFQNDPDSLKLMFLQTKAGGTSLTLDAADDVIILDEMWNPDNQEQVEDRAHRLSRIDHHVTVWYLRSLATIEEYIGTTLEERRNTCKGIMDGQRGVAFSKSLLRG